MKLERNQVISEVLDLQNSHEEEMCKLKETQDYLTEKLQIASVENDSKLKIQELEDYHKKEVTYMERVQEDFKMRCEMLENDKRDQSENIEQLVKTLNECEKSLHTLDSDKNRIAMDNEKERLRSSQMDFYMKDMQQK